MCPVKSEGLGRKLKNLKKIVFFFYPYVAKYSIMCVCSEIHPLKIDISPDFFIFLILYV